MQHADRAIRFARDSLAWSAVAMTVAGCALQPSSHYATTLTQANHSAPMAADVAQCRDVLARAFDSDHPRLDSSAIRLVNWNVQKGSTSSWWGDLEPILHDNHLALFQEAAFSEHMLDDERFFSFAPGFATQRAVTGVVTFSHIAPLARCNLSVREPWLGTPKATSITEFALSDSDETLVVVNLHAVNFALGLADFEAQMADTFDAVQNHQGPLIISGDFNTWRGGRSELVRKLTMLNGLAAVEYPDDQRVQVFGQHLDQIYIRDLTVVKSSTATVTSSDHNPMYVTLRLQS